MCWLCPAPGRGRTPSQGPWDLVGRGAARDHLPPGPAPWTSLDMPETADVAPVDVAGEPFAFVAHNRAQLPIN